MYLQQSDILQGLDRSFVKQFMEITTKETHPEGTLLFNRGDPAAHFYILLKGRIKLILGESGPIVYTVSHPGEAFAWSSLIGREEYSASARCAVETKTLKIERSELLKIMERDPAQGMSFFRKLAATLGNRLLMSYRMKAGSAAFESTPSLGTGQVGEASIQA